MQEYPFILNTSIAAYGAGILPLFEENVESADNPVLDAHLARQANMEATMAGWCSLHCELLCIHRHCLIGIGIGYPSGDYLGMLYDCRYNRTAGCTDMERMVTQVRGPSTQTRRRQGQRQLLEYNIKPDATGYSHVRDTSVVTNNYGLYSSSSRDWFKQAAAAPLMSGTCWGEPVVTSVYVWIGPLISVAQAFYVCNSTTLLVNYGDTLGGVLVVDFDFYALSESLDRALPNSDCQSAVAQMFGEKIASSDYDTTSVNSDGGVSRLNVTNTNLKALRNWANKLWPDNLNFIQSQNQTSIFGDNIDAAWPCTTYLTDYLFIANRFVEWSLLLVYPRDLFYDTLDNQMVC